MRQNESIVNNSFIHQLVIGVKGAGEMATAIARRLYMANIRKIFMMERRHPIAVRREVSFCEAIYEGSQTVEGVTAVYQPPFKSLPIDGRNGTPAHRDNDREDRFHSIWGDGKIVVLPDPEWKSIGKVTPHVVVDAILAKKNLGTHMKEAPLVIGLGPGLVAGIDVHMAIETHRGHHLGRIITDGSPEPNTGIPGNIGGFSAERVMRSPMRGVFRSRRKIGDRVEPGEIVGHVDDGKMRENVCSQLSGIIRGLIRSETVVAEGLKLGDIDPRGDVSYCYTISDKARAIAGSVLEAVMRKFNRPVVTDR